MDERDAMVFYKSFRDAIKSLPKKDQLATLWAVIDYGLDGADPENLSSVENAIYLLIRPVLTKGRNKAANGKKGGSKSKASAKQAEAVSENACDFPSMIKDKRQEIKDKRQEIKDKRQGIKDKTSNDEAPAPAADSAESDFAAFWEAYPCTIDRPAAWEAWEDLDPDPATVDQIMQALEAWKGSERWQEKGGRFIPRAAKWLSEQHWESPPASDWYHGHGERQLDDDERAAIQRMMGEDSHA